MLLCLSVVHSFLFPLYKNIPVYPSMLVIDIWVVPRSFNMFLFFLGKQIPRNGIFRAQDRCMFHIITNCQTVHLNDCTILCPCHQCMRVPPGPFPYPHLVLSVFFILVDVKCYLLWFKLHCSED